MANSQDKVLGFQFEPRKNAGKDTGSESEWESCYEDEEDEENVHVERLNKAVSSWCTCGKCSEMGTEKECFCCIELEADDLLTGKL